MSEGCQENKMNKTLLSSISIVDVILRHVAHKKLVTKWSAKTYLPPFIILWRVIVDANCRYIELVSEELSLRVNFELGNM